MAERQVLVGFASAARTATENGAELDIGVSRGIHATLDITAASGTTPTLDVKWQGLDVLSGKWTDIPGAAFAQKTGTGTDTLQLFPGIAETANREQSVALPRRIRPVATIGGGTPSFTFSLAVDTIP